MKVHSVVFLLSMLCSVCGQNYLQCFKVKSLTVVTVNSDLQKVRKTVTIKGGPVTGRIPISDVFQRINSTLLFGRHSYPPNVVCEYRFVIRRTTKIKFTKIHLDSRPGDPTSGVVHFGDCERASKLEFKDRDFIKLNTSHQQRVFCGRRDRDVTRRIRKKHLLGGQSDLIVTFWSDASFSGDGFDGYFVDLRRRPEPGTLIRGVCPDTEPVSMQLCTRVTDFDLADIGWKDVDEEMDRVVVPLMYGQKYSPAEQNRDDLIRWMVNQSEAIDLSQLWDFDQPTMSSAPDTGGTLNGTSTTPSPVPTQRSSTSQPAGVTTRTIGLSNTTPLPKTRSPVSSTARGPTSPGRKTTVAFSANSGRVSSSPSPILHDVEPPSDESVPNAKEGYW